MVRCVEAGHIFKLGLLYAEKIGIHVSDPDGNQQPVVMGSYGIGIGRNMATIAETHHDDSGLIWPVSVAPYEVVVTPLRSDRRLRYVYRVRRNREAVAAATDGKIGYVHLPDMDAAGLREFETWFYPQLTREGSDERGDAESRKKGAKRKAPARADGNGADAPAPNAVRDLNRPLEVVLHRCVSLLGADELGHRFPRRLPREHFLLDIAGDGLRTR